MRSVATLSPENDIAHSSSVEATQAHFVTRFLKP